MVIRTLICVVNPVQRELPAAPARSRTTAWQGASSRNPREDPRRELERADMRFKKAGIIEEEKASGVAAKAQRDTRALLDSGREQGHLTADEIAGALDELDLEPAQIDDFYHALEELHIEILNTDEE